MGYSKYELADGRMAGYAVEGTCDRTGCQEQIHRGLAYLCGPHPNCGGDPVPGCGDYFCQEHRYAHDCPAPECGLFPRDGGGACIELVDHDLPHRNDDGEFTKTEQPSLHLATASTPTESGQ